MNLFRTFSVSGSALTAEKARLDVVADNLANMQTTRTAAGGPYRRKTTVFAQRLEQARNMPPTFQGNGVKIQAVVEDPNPPRLEYDPEHPDANEDGFVAYPNIDMAKEMTDLITSTRSYESSVTAINSAKNMYLKALEIGRG